MYSDFRLDTPPPDSRFRRPWSPDLHDSTQTGRHTQEARREPSEVSVEALDLADYARNLRMPQPQFRPEDPYPPSPRAIRPFSKTSLQPPPLMSPGGISSTKSSSRSPLRRPYSLPTPSSILHSSSQTYLPQHVEYQETEVDITSFPAFSRHWYKGNKPLTKSPESAYHSVPHAEVISPFDPSFPTHKYNSYDKLPFSEPPGYPSSHSYDSHSRNLLPWTNEDQDQSLAPVEGEVKQERMRMLEKEFGGIGKPGFGTSDEDNVIGSVDHRGHLITQGPKKRRATRWLQAILTLGVAISAIYTSLVPKPKEKPPPQGKLPLYVLYVLSIVTFLWVIYLFIIYPSCCLGRRNKSSNFTDPTSGPGGGMMILPVQHLPGGKKHKGNKKGQKGKKGMGMGGDVQVNLIVDPAMFGGGRGARDADEEEGDEERWATGSASDRTAGGKPRPQKRRSVFAGLALEERWKTARKYLKWSTAFDCVSFLLWGIEFVLILIGKRCPSGSFEGWCDAYNFATALSCFSCVLFGLAVFFDVKDLHASRISPRTRT